MIHNLWVEGFSATGQNAHAMFLGQFKADSFKEACDIYGKRSNTYKSGESPSEWGCRIFDNEKDARKSFG